MSVVWLLVGTACDRQAARNGAALPGDSAALCSADVRRVVDRFGARFKLVSLLAPDPVLERSLRMAYAPFVTPELLAHWQAHPQSAPGRAVSNPWPMRIAIRALHAEADGCVVEGDVVYVETADTASVLELRPVTMRVRRSNDGWRVSEYETSN